MPKGGATSLIPVYAGLQADLDNFLKAFLCLDTRRFTDYKNLFKQLGMVKMFNGRSDSAEIIEFNEHLLVYCQPYMEEYYCHGVKRSLEERLFGLYSMYTFFYLQQTYHVVKVKMDVFAFDSFSNLFDQLFEEKIFDAVLCCSKLYEDKAFRIVAYACSYDPTLFKRYRTDANLNGLPVLANCNDPLSSVKEMLKSPLFVGLGVFHEEYMKKREAAGFSKDGAMLPNPYNSVKAIVERNIREVESQIKVPMIAKVTTSVKHEVNRSSIKERAYKAEVKLPKFLRHEPAEIKRDPEQFAFVKAEPDTVDFYEYKPVAKAEQGSYREFDDVVESPAISKKPKRESRRRRKVSDDDKEKVLKKKPAMYDAPTAVKPSGRRTNNSIASELFCLDGHSAVQQTPNKSVSKKPKVEPDADIKMEIKEETLSQDEMDAESEDRLGIDEHAESPAPSRKSILKTSPGSPKSVSFEEKQNGEIVVRVRDISPREKIEEEEIVEEDSAPLFAPCPARFKVEVAEGSQEIEEQPVIYNPRDLDDMFVPLENEEQLLREEAEEGFDVSLDLEVDEDA